jgi:O-antigen ligase
MGTSTTEFLAMNSRRIVGTHMDPNFFGALLSSSLVICLALWWRVRESAGRLAMTAGLALLGAALVLTLSRGALLGLAAGLVALLMLTPRRMRFGAALGCAVLAAWALGLPDYKSEHSVWTLRERLQCLAASGDPNQANRLHGLYIAGVVFSNHPVFGSGLETFRERMSPFSSRFSLPAVYSCHTVPALILAETGAVGFLIFNAFLVVICIGVVRLARAAPEAETGVLGRHLAATVAALLVVGLTIDVLYSRFFWITLALADGLVLASLCSTSCGEAAAEGDQ